MNFLLLTCYCDMPSLVYEPQVEIVPSMRWVCVCGGGGGGNGG